MNGIEGCHITAYTTNHPHLVAGTVIYWDDAWQIPVYDEGLWTVGVMRSDGRFYLLELDCNIYNWPKAIAIQICNQLADAGAYIGDARDRAINDRNHEARSLYMAYSQHSEWRGRNDADYEASGAGS